MRKIAVPLFLLATACASNMATNSSSSSNDAESYIRAAVPRFISAFNSGNADALSSFYADDAVLLLPNAPVARGAAGVRQAFMSMSGARPTLDFAPDRINVCGDMATEVGHYTMSADRGNYVAVWRRQSDGTWKMTADSVVSTVPMSMSH